MQLILFIILLVNLSVAYSSTGDKAKFHQNCIYDCEKGRCRAENSERGVFIRNGSLEIRLWNCKDDCKYECMWSTVEAFQKRNWGTPQFHGKWPFARAFGLQEPASAIFSVANLWVVFKYMNKFRKEVHSDSPFYRLWLFYYLVSINCWIWSTIFHTRDTDATERMDYISASLLVFSAFFCMTVRTLKLSFGRKSLAWTAVCVGIVFNHVAYLWLYKFDYTYNMGFNVIVGALAVAGWLIWSAVAVKQGHPCPRTVAGYCVIMAAATVLELLDFPPIFWVFDAHAVWHLSTCFIYPIFFSFISEDCAFLRKLKMAKLAKID